MKQLITLSILLLAGSSFASAQQTFDATSGSMVVADEFPNFAVAGPGFSYSGAMFIGDPSPLNGPFGAGPPPEQIFLGEVSTDAGDLSSVSLAVHGVPWAFNPNDGISGADVGFIPAPVVFPGPGTVTGSFTLIGRFFGAPASVLAANPSACVELLCSVLEFQGSGTATYDVVPIPGIPGALQISQATFTIKAPEPPTMALLLLGFAGLVALSRRRSPAILLPAE